MKEGLKRVQNKDIETKNNEKWKGQGKSIRYCMRYFKFKILEDSGMQ